MVKYNETVWGRYALALQKSQTEDLQICIYNDIWKDSCFLNNYCM